MNISVDDVLDDLSQQIGAQAKELALLRVQLKVAKEELAQAHEVIAASTPTEGSE